MILDYKEIEQKICNDIAEIQKQLHNLYQTIDETKEYGFKVTFGANDEEEGYKSAFNAGRTIGELEGKIDQLNHFLNFLYNKEYQN